MHIQQCNNSMHIDQLRQYQILIQMSIIYSQGKSDIPQIAREQSTISANILDSSSAFIC